MQVSETLNDGLKRAYEIAIPASELDAKVEDKLKEIQPKVQMKGFRKGKVPLALLKRQYGREVLGETLQESIDEAVKKLLADNDHRPVGRPDVRMKDENWEPGQDVVLVVEYELMPEMPEVDLGKITVKRPVVEVAEKDVEEALEKLAAEAKVFEKKDGPAEEGDQVVIDFTGKLDGEPFEGGTASDYPLEIGSGQFIPGFEEQLVGAKAGESREVKVTFPEDYGAEHLAGKEVVFDVTVKEVKKPVKAKVDDALAQQFGMEGLDQLREKIREQMAEDLAGGARAVVKRRLLDALNEAVEFELPPSLVETEAKEIAHQLWHEEHPDHQGHDHPEIEVTDEHRKLAERRVKLGLFLAHLGEKAGIEVTEEEMRNAILAEARRYPGQEAQFLQFIQQNPQMQQQLRAPIFEDKVVDYILELADVEDEPMDREGLQKTIDEMENE